MRVSTIIACTVSYIIGAAVTFGIVWWLRVGFPELTFIVGAVVGMQVAAINHRRRPEATNSLPVKLAIGVTLAVLAVATGLALHFKFAPFKFVVVTVPMSAIGCFVCPFVLFDTMWRGLSKSKD